jgi:GNAT superfamily N-acetyltransferase
MITIKRLTSELFPDYIRLHESVTFEHAPQWKGCYCLYYLSNLSFNEWVNTSFDAKKALVKTAIHEGRLTGFLAYDGDRAIGWLNINEIGSYLRIASLLQKYQEMGKVALSICFLIDKDWRGQGIARQLLDAAIAYYREQDYDALLALPTDEDSSGPQRYRGTYHMYVERGYQEIGHSDRGPVMRLFLK